MAESDNKGRAVLQQFEKLKSLRQPLDSSYRDCYRFNNPSLGVGFEGGEIDSISDAVSAQSKQAQLLDSTGTDSVQLLSSSTLSSLTGLLSVASAASQALPSQAQARGSSLVA